MRLRSSILLATLLPGCRGSGKETADTGACPIRADLRDSTLADAFLVGPDRSSMAGRAVAGARDLDGDGKDDLLTGAEYRIYAVYGVPSGEGELSDAGGVLVGADDSNIGSVLAGVGDVDGDGLDDVLVGSLASSRAFLVFGPISGELSEADASAQGDDDDLGEAVAGTGDIDGDGLADLLLGAPSMTGESASTTGACATEDDEYADGQYAGGALLLVGEAARTLDISDPEARLLGEDGGDSVGVALAGLGDVDGDGVPDLLIGAPGQCAAGAWAGTAYVVYGPVHGDLSLADADARINGAGAEELIGSNLAPAGDVNGDGRPDLLLSDEQSAFPVGEAFLFEAPYASSADLSAADAVFEGLDGENGMGTSLSTAGDQDRDGYDDVLIGYYYPTILLYHGPISGHHSWRGADILISPAGDWNSPNGTALAGDLDADGLPDLALGAPGYDASTGSSWDEYNYRGGVYILLGGGAVLGATCED